LGLLLALLLVLNLRWILAKSIKRFRAWRKKRRERRDRQVHFSGVEGGLRESLRVRPPPPAEEEELEELQPPPPAPEASSTTTEQPQGTRMEVMCGSCLPGWRRLAALFRGRTVWTPAHREGDVDDNDGGMEMKERSGKKKKATASLFSEHVGDTMGEGRSFLRPFRLPTGLEDDDYFLFNDPTERFTADRGIQVNVRRAPRCLINRNEFDF
jgi:hypothetical protein